MSITPEIKVPPPGYGKLPSGLRCRCPGLWTDGTDHWCCKGTAARLDNTNAGAAPPPAVPPDEPLPIYIRLLLIAQSYAPETVTITPADAKRILAAMDAVRTLRHAITYERDGS